MLEVLLIYFSLGAVFTYRYIKKQAKDKIKINHIPIIMLVYIVWGFVVWEILKKEDII